MYLFIGSYKSVTYCAVCSFAFDDTELPCPPSHSPSKLLLVQLSKAFCLEQHHQECGPELRD